MTYGIYDGRVQNITEGRIEDILTAYDLACVVGHLGDELMVLMDGEHTKAVEKREKFDFLGTLDNFILGIAACDPCDVRPEEEPEGKEETVKRFMDPKHNPLTYFQRMIIHKELLLERGVDVKKLDILPHFPGHLYPGAKGLFENIDEMVFRYLGIENEHHWDRVDRKKTRSEEQPFFYQDFRGRPDAETRDVLAKYHTEDVDDIVFGFYSRRFLVDENGDFSKELKHSIDFMLEDSVKDGRPLVLGIVTLPRLSDRNAAAERWKKPYEDVVRLTPFETYMTLKAYLIEQGADLTTTHITMMTPDTILGADNPRDRSYMPKQFLFYSEKLDKPVILKKNDVFSNLPGCIGMTYTTK